MGSEGIIKVSTSHPDGDMNVCIQFHFIAFHSIDVKAFSVKTTNVNLIATGKIRGLPVGFILWGHRASVQNYNGSPFNSCWDISWPKWWTACLTNRPSVAKKIIEIQVVENILCLDKVEWTVLQTTWTLWLIGVTWTLSAMTATRCTWMTRTADHRSPDIRWSSVSPLTLVATSER